MLVRCLYASRPAGSLSAEMVDSILDQSRRNNPLRGITGLLCYTPEVFVQVLEGGRDEVSDLYNTIVGDSRHKGVRLLAFDEIAVRRFGSWTMGQVEIGRANPMLLLKYSEKAELNPFICSGATVMALLNDLVESGAICSRMR